MADGNVVVPFFYIKAIENRALTIAEGRPIFEDKEFVEYRFAGNRYLNLHFPAHEMHERVMGEDITHAMRWPDQYAQFKRDGVNEISGTPLEELTFLTNAERSELKALKIYTAEALAQLDGPIMKSLGGKGYRYKELAEAYLNQSQGAAGVAKLVSQLEEMKAEIALLRENENSEANSANMQAEVFGVEHSEMTEADLREAIFVKHGVRPRGPASREKLLNMLAQDAAA